MNEFFFAAQASEPKILIMEFAILWLIGFHPCVISAEMHLSENDICNVYFTVFAQHLTPV